jgi:hypothetical protein
MVERQARRAVVGELVAQHLVATRSWIGVACFLIGLPAAAAEPPAPVADIRTPEAALRSYWEVLDWNDAVRRSRPADPHEAEYNRLMIQLTAGATRKFYESIGTLIAANRRTQLERKILTTTPESPQRTIIVANVRNVTPIPPGMKPPSPFVQQLREKGENFRYVLALEGSEWRIVEVWNLAMGSRQLYGQSSPDYPAFVPPQ